MGLQFNADKSDAEALPITGRANVGLQALDRMMAAFVMLYDVPGAAMAVTRGRRLVYARGFGYADVENKEPVQPDMLFRIGSVSKPITAAAVLRLVEKGKLALTDHPFDLLAFTPYLEEGTKADPRLKDVTIQQLLQHTAGWDRDVTAEPVMGLGPNFQEHVIRYMMGQPLDFAPGMRCAYSNFGYCVLGRVIEKVSGQTYEEHVRTEILAPLGITDMWIGKTFREEKRANEATYYDSFQRMGLAVLGPQIGNPVPLPYGTWCHEAIDSSGGWIASARDLVRFASAFDVPERCPILDARSVATMFDRPPANAGYDESGIPRDYYYACGWEVRPIEDTGTRNTWHGGAVMGAAAYLVRRCDGINWAVVFNTMEAPHGASLGELIDFYGTYSINKIEQWPEIDLFDKYV